MSGTILLVLGLGALFLGVLLLLTAIGTLTPERHTVSRSLAAVEAISTAPSSMRRELERPFSERVVGDLWEWLVALGRRLTPVAKADALRRKISLAGSPAGWSVDRILAFKALGLFVLGGLGLLLPLVMTGSVVWALALGIGGAALGYFLPNIVLYQKAYNRSRLIERMLPDSLDLLTVSVEAGMGFDAALNNVSRNTEGPLADEFFRVLQEMQLGTGRMDALRALSARTDVADLQSFINAMIQADAFGIPIANVLRVQAKEMRTRRMQRAEEAAQKVPVKILFPLIFFILPSLLIVVIGPAVITVMDNLL
jgi:tight adherence protein C